MMSIRPPLHSLAGAYDAAEQPVCSAPVADGGHGPTSFTADGMARGPAEDGWHVPPLLPDSLLLHFPRAAPRVKVARSTVSAWLRHRCRMSEERTDTIVLILSELVINAIRHGKRDDIAVRVSTSADGTALVEVKDFTPSAVPCPTQAGTEEENGRGLWLVQSLVDALGGIYQHSLDGTTAWCRVPLQEPDARPLGRR
ncbi:ATP-binding protein [Streptomyces sp. NPDC055722]